MTTKIGEIIKEISDAEDERSHEKVSSYFEMLLGKVGMRLILMRADN